MMIYKLSVDEADSVGDSARRQRIPTTEFIRRAIASAVDAEHDTFNGPFTYLVIDGSANDKTSRSSAFPLRSECIETAIKHGVLLVRSERCEIHVLDDCKNSIWSGLFRNGKKVSA